MNRKNRRSAKSQGASQSPLTQTLLTEGARHHQAGQLPEAEKLYRQLLAVEPRHADALHLLGLLAYQVGRHDVAIDMIGQAIQVKNNVSAYHNNIGNAYRNLRRLDDAIKSYKRALALTPSDPELFNNLGVVIEEQGKFDEAATLYKKAIALRPDYINAHYNLGNVLAKKHDFDEAVKAYQRALDFDPRQFVIWSNLANALRGLTRFADALDACERALALKPDHAEAHIMMGMVFRDQEKLDEAVACYRRAIECRPDSVEAYNNLGVVLHDQEKLQESLDAYQKAFILRPKSAQVCNNVGAALEELGQFDAASDYYRQALVIEPDCAESFYNLGNVAKRKGELPQAIGFYSQAIISRSDYVEAYWNRAFLLLLSGNFKDGWRESEWRWRRKGITPHDHFAPLWDGKSLTGKTILLQSEQGLGDSLQFIRYAPLVKAKGGRVLLLCPPALAPLFETVAGIDKIFTDSDTPPDCDCQSPLVTLPSLLDTALENIPAEVPYLHAHTEQVNVWRERLKDLSGLKVGVVWRGNPFPKNNRDRSMKPEQFANFLNQTGLSIVSLQKDGRPEEFAALGAKENFFDAGPLLGDFADTAALVSCLDLVISIDTSVCHLAGALGVPVWTLLLFSPDWRWLMDRNDSPWYPSMRLFRQAASGTWEAPINAIAAALQEKIASVSQL